MTRLDLLIVAVGLLVGGVMGVVAARELPRLLNSLTVEVTE